MNAVNIRQGDTEHGLAIDCHHLKKSFGDHQVLKGIDLALPYGSMLGLLGRNGAGKSTLISILTGLSRQSSGRATVCGIDVKHSKSGELGHAVGLAPQQLGLYPQLTAMQNLVNFGMLQGLSGKRAKARASELLEIFSLESQAKQKASRLSGGQQRRLHTAIALVHHPRLLFLDEPTVGADIDARASIFEAVKAIAAEGTAIVYTSHYLDEFERLGADIAFLDGGQIVESGTQREVIDRHAEAVIEATFEGGTQPDIPGWTVADAHLERRYGKSGPGEALAQLTTVSNRLGLRLSDVKVTRASLENAYHHIISEPDSKGINDIAAQINTVTTSSEPSKPTDSEIRDEVVTASTKNAPNGAVKDSSVSAMARNSADNTANNHTPTMKEND
ncbi:MULTISPECIES: ABC transporter ATP-binding protein [unclassified Bifidobacterium]|uniref:ABC transporter ATP-binding protein n=1 Tax=unclassified Bifidobacterium TaxID=2608897 RepID=UPI0023F88EEB|nr:MULTISPECIES: ABC transporter ATP-binding protein [unclassified Bifidobacterium]WEV66187.1 ABC transporter ATP-binding protein [Bifidobacterium sp. ESL0764]WEV75026.1 ABC transporter ATP-binding protein [Bifidobacterium sp. ESL0800]